MSGRKRIRRQGAEEEEQEEAEIEQGGGGQEDETQRPGRSSGESGSLPISSTGLASWESRLFGIICNVWNDREEQGQG